MSGVFLIFLVCKMLSTICPSVLGHGKEEHYHVKLQLFLCSELSIFVFFSSASYVRVIKISALKEKVGRKGPRRLGNSRRKKMKKE